MSFSGPGSGFQNPPVGNQGQITRPKFCSTNYVPGVSGWAIFRNGNCEFNAGTFRGTITEDGTILLYNGTATLGNLIGSWASASGVDQYGNIFPPGLTIGGVTVPQIAMTNDANGSYLSFLTNTTDSVGVAQSIIQALITNNGAANQQLALLISSMASNAGSADPNFFTMQASAGADDGSAPASWQLFDSYATPYLSALNPNGANPQLLIGQGSNGSQTFLNGLLNGCVLTYGLTAGMQVKKTFSSTGTMVFPTGVTTARAQNWASGAGGQWSSGPGGGSGEYAENAALAVTAGPTYTATVPIGGNGGTSGSGTGKAGADATFAQGVTTLVRAHGAPVNNTNPSTGGTGSTDPIHHNGAGCTASSTGAGQGGSGGAGSPSPTAVGNTGHANSGASPGSGGNGPYATGGSGGWGNGSSNSGTTVGGAGGNGGAGGGSGGAGPSSGANGGKGGNGQVIVTYTLPGSTTIQSSFSSAAGTDASGNAFPAGYMGAVAAVQPGSSPNAVEAWHAMTLLNSWSNRGAGFAHASYRITADNCVEIVGQITHASTSGSSVICTLPTGYLPSSEIPGIGYYNGGTGVIPVNLETSGNVTVFGMPAGTTSLAFTCRYPLGVL